MNRAKRYIVNALILSACTLLMRTVSVAFNAFCVQKVGSEGMGLFSLVMSVYTFALTLATSGVNLASTRLVALHFGKGAGTSVRSAMRKCLLYAAAFGTLASLLLFAFASGISERFLQQPRAAMSVRALSFSLLPLSLCSAFSGYFTAVRRVYKNAVSQVFEQTVKILSCTFLLSVLLPRGVEYACLALVLGGAVSEIFSFGVQLLSYLADLRTLPRGGGAVEMRRVTEIALPVAFSAYVRSGLVTLEHILIPIGLAAYGEANALAAYGVISAAALPILLYPYAFVGAFAGQVIPEVTELHAEKKHLGVRYVTTRAFYTTLLFAFPIAGMFAAFSTDFCVVVYGSREAAAYLRVLAPLLPVMFLDTVTDSILKGLGKQVYTMCVNIADAAVSVLLVWWLVPRVGVYGYVAVLYISECVNTVCSIGKLLSVAPPRLKLWKLVFAPLLAVLAASRIAVLCMRLLALPLCAWTLLLECAILLALYLLFARILGALGKEEIQWLRKVSAKP